MGAACLSRLTVARKVEAGWLRLLDIEGINKSRQFWFIQHEDKVVTRLIAEFLRFCENAVQKQLDTATLSSPWKLSSGHCRFHSPLCPAPSAWG